YSLKNWLEASDMHKVTEYYRDTDGKIKEPGVHQDIGFTWDTYWASAYLVAEGPGIYDFLKSLDGTHLLITGEGKAAFANLRINLVPDSMQGEDCYDWATTLPLPDGLEVRVIQTDDLPAFVDVSSGFASLNSEHRIWKLINSHLPVVDEFLEFVTVISK
ncbi:MAG: hypothetical protein P1V20_08760, partial [Verrucomicrobiales bacterium]|nr:hypothetical protein [Verrucomicrobiales bacterium]